MEKKRIITFGTFDVIDEKQINMLKLLKNYNEIENVLIVGVNKDEFNQKSTKTIEIRIKELQKLNIADEIFVEESSEEQDYYIKKFNADLFAINDTNNNNNNSNIQSIFDKYNNYTQTLISDYIKNMDSLIRIIFVN